MKKKIIYLNYWKSIYIGLVLENLYLIKYIQNLQCFKYIKKYKVDGLLGMGFLKCFLNQRIREFREWKFC